MAWSSDCNCLAILLWRTVNGFVLIVKNNQVQIYFYFYLYWDWLSSNVIGTLFPFAHPRKVNLLPQWTPKLRKTLEKLTNCWHRSKWRRLRNDASDFPDVKGCSYPSRPEANQSAFLQGSASMRLTYIFPSIQLSTLDLGHFHALFHCIACMVVSVSRFSPLL